MRLENKVAIITGAGSGIGRETALLFAKEGAKVAITGRTAEKLEEVCNEIHENGGKAIFKIGDVSKREDVDNVVNTAMNEFGRIDILVNNGASTKTPL
jgi:NAD(P)-dependent dehydrogenase (short-subunit alcohol dehydrogenase family)